jgi:hypothetical protein
MFLPPVRIAIIAQDITETCFSFRAEVDQGKRRSQLFLPFVGSPCHCLPKRALVPREGFELVDTVSNDSPLLRFQVLQSWIWERAPPHAFLILCQRGTTV